MKPLKRLVLVIALAMTAIFALSASSCQSEEFDNRQTSNEENEVDTLGEIAQQKRLEREEDANAVRYVYLMSFGQIVGYYVISGGVYDAGTQLTPEQEILCKTNTSSECWAVDSPHDNGTYGESGEGVFFFTVDGTLVETDLDYIQSDQPLPIDTPRLGGEE